MGERFRDDRKKEDIGRYYPHDELVLAGCYLLEKKKLPYWLWYCERGREEKKLIRYNTPKMQIVLPEMFTWGNRPDVIGYNLMGFSVCLECKASRSDFLRDKLKTNKHPGDVVYYLTKPGIIDVNKDADRLGNAGVVEWDGQWFYVKHSATADKEYKNLYNNIEVSILVRVLMYEKISGIKDYRGIRKDYK